MFFLRIIVLLALNTKIFCEEIPPIESLPLSNWLNPTDRDYRILENYLHEKYSERALAPRVKKSFKNIKFVGNGSLPKLNVKYLNNDKHNKKNLIIAYGTLVDEYKDMIQELIESICKVGFDGHLMYQIGGWPNTEQGDLFLCDVPYSFKICFFREAQRLGYKNVLWLDTSVIVNKRLEPIFSLIEENGCVYRYSNHPLRIPRVARDNFSPIGKNGEPIKHIAAGILGFDLHNPKVKLLLDKWYNLAVDYPEVFFSNFPEQLPLSIVIQEMGMDDYPLPLEWVAIGKKETILNQPILSVIRWGRK